MTGAVPTHVASAWQQFRRGAMAPLVVVRKARLAGEPWRAYVRLVRLHLLFALLVMAAAAPFVLKGVSVYEERDASVKKVNHEVAATTPPRGIEMSAASDDDDHDATPAFLVTHAPSLLPLWAALGSLYAAWVILELAISMLWMEHLDWLTEQLTRAVGLPVLQPIDRKPRVRVNLRWGVQKAWRQLLAAVMIASGVPFFLLVRFAPHVGPTLYAILLSLWTVYWLLVTTAAKSASAWTTPSDRAPWFLRSWTTVTTRTFGFRWFLPRVYGSAWTWLTRALHRAAILWEERPYPFAGLALVRTLGSLPLVSIVVKPILPTAAELIASGALDGDVGATEPEKSRSPETA